MMPVRVECACCGHESTQQELTSTSTFGAPDLDLRPAEIARSTLFVQVQECPACGYCARDLSEAPDAASEIVNSVRYTELRLATTPCDLARRFLLASLVEEHAANLPAAGWSAVRAAWACDDDNDPAGALESRERAIALFRSAADQGERFGEDVSSEIAVLADILRRAERFEEAIAVSESALPDCAGVVGSVLAFQVSLSRAGDSRAYTVSHAVEGAPREANDDQPTIMQLGDRFDEALGFASELHRTQPRKGTGVPYVSHLLGVASLVLEDEGSEDEAIAALLHDAVEDGGGRQMLSEIRRRFGDEVAEIVLGTSDTDEMPKPPWRARKERYIAHLVEDGRPSVVRVSLADKLHNVRALTRDLRVHGEDVWERFNPESDQLWYYRTLANTFAALSESPMVADLEREVDELETLAIVSSLKRLEEYRARKEYAYQFVIVRGDDTRNYYIQFAVDEGGLFCEAVHNMYLEDEDKLTSDQVGELLELGWDPPDNRDQNLYRTFHPAGEEDLREIAELTRRTLEDVYRVPPGRPLGLSTSWRPERSDDEERS